MSETRRRFGPGNAFLALAGVLLVLGAFEALLHRIDFVPDYWDWHGTQVELDRELLYRLRGHSRADLNSLGYRDYEFEGQGRPRLLMSGDSFVFGDNVASHQTLPKALERALGGAARVFNLGIAGDGPDQAYARMLRDGLRFAPDAVVLALYPANDFGDLVKNRLYVFDAQGELAFNAENPVALAIPRFRTGILLRKLLTGRGLSAARERELNQVLGFDPIDRLTDARSPASAEKLRLMRAVLRMFRDTLVAEGVDFSVLIIPSLEDMQDETRFPAQGIDAAETFVNEDLALQICLEEGIDALDLRATFLEHRDQAPYQVGDGHLSVRGNLLAARALAEHLRARGMR